MRGWCECAKLNQWLIGHDQYFFDAELPNGPTKHLDRIGASKGQGLGLGLGNDHGGERTLGLVKPLFIKRGHVDTSETTAAIVSGSIAPLQPKPVLMAR
jgi:hypothetical protein